MLLSASIGYWAEDYAVDFTDCDDEYQGSHPCPPPPPSAPTGPSSLTLNQLGAYYFYASISGASHVLLDILRGDGGHTQYTINSGSGVYLSHSYSSYGYFYIKYRIINPDYQYAQYFPYSVAKQVYVCCSGSGGGNN